MSETMTKDVFFEVVNDAYDGFKKAQKLHRIDIDLVVFARSGGIWTYNNYEIKNLTQNPVFVFHANAYEKIPRKLPSSVIETAHNNYLQARKHIEARDLLAV